MLTGKVVAGCRAVLGVTVPECASRGIGFGVAGRDLGVNSAAEFTGRHV